MLVPAYRFVRQGIDNSNPDHKKEVGHLLDGYGIGPVPQDAENGAAGFIFIQRTPYIQ
jgi:hypothetical protein